jgi:hypothetical protein
MADPSNGNFIYQRFQRVIMHYRAECQCTEFILLASYFKNVITGVDLPPDLDQEMQGTPYYKQYNNGAPHGLNRPNYLPNTDLTNAFEPQSARNLTWAGGSAPGPLTSTRGGVILRVFRVLAAAVAVLLLGQSVVLAAPGAQEQPPQEEPAQPNVPQPYRAATPEYGIVVQAFGQPTAERDFQLVKQMGFKWVKLQMPWRAMQPQRDVDDWAEADRVIKLANAYDLSVIARVSDTPDWARSDFNQNGAVDGPPDNFQDYGNFIYKFVRRFRKGDQEINAVEIWNEPNIAREWANQPPNPAQYVQLLQVASEQAKLANPSITVLSAAMTPTGTSDATAMPDDEFIGQMYLAGGQPYFDVLAVHAPGYKAPPEMDPAAVEADPSFGGHRFFSFRHVEDIRALMVDNGDEAKQIWVTEFGWTSDPREDSPYHWHAVTEEEKGDYLVRAFQWAHANWAPWMGVMTAWTLAAPYWTTADEHYYWAVNEPTGEPRPAYTKLSEARATGALP